MNENAADNLLGRKLKSGWEVIEKIEKSNNATGSFFSICYKVKKDNDTCFLKAFDFNKFMSLEPGIKVVDIMAKMLDAYRYEKKISDFCKGHHVTKVLFVKYAEEENIDGFTIPIVPYLIFDLVDGDIRKNLDYSDRLDYAWRLKSLHDISVGLKQLHYINVSHQDLKPSNILIHNGDSKIGDLGRSICKTISSPYENIPFAGDRNYAPPEIMYGYYLQDWNQRVFSSDSYLLGSIVVFYFTGISMTALLAKYIPREFHWANWNGNYEEVKTYILDAFEQAVSEFSNSISDEYLRGELKWIVDKLCFPIPEKRGHPRNYYMNNKYNLDRFVTKLDLLHKKTIYRIKHNGSII